MMRVLTFALRGLVREFKGGELLVLMAALGIAVASVTAIGFLTDRVSQAVSLQAAEVLAADIRLRSSSPLDSKQLSDAEARGLKTAEIVSFPSVVYAGESSSLASIRAVTDNYPLRGRLRVASKLFAAEQEIDTTPQPGEVWLERPLLARLGIDTGATVALGDRNLKVTRVLRYRPDQGTGFASLAPTVLFNAADLASTDLIRGGSRVTYMQLYAGPRDAIKALASDFDKNAPATVRVQTQGEANANLNQAIDQASRFLALASLASLVLAAVAVAMSARRYAERRLDTAALMKSLGASQNFVAGVNLVQLAIIALLASLLGALLGYLAAEGLTKILADLLRVELPRPSLEPIWLGVGTAFILLIGFGMPSLLALRRTPPLRVLRDDVEPPPPAAYVTYALALSALGCLVYWSVRDLKLVAIILGGSVLMGLVLYVAGRMLIALLGRFRGAVGVSWRYGLANVARRGELSAIQVVAFGLGLMVLLFLTFVRNDLMGSWRDTLTEDAPNRFLINIQPYELDGVREILNEAGLTDTAFIPMIRARMVRLNGVAVDDLDFKPNTRARGFVRREANLTFAKELQVGNEIAAGRFWSPDHSGGPEVSVDEEVMADLGVTLGDTVTYQIAGEDLTATITSVRSIQWDTFLPNFFMVFSPGALDDYPMTFVSGFYVDESQQTAMLKLARNFPSVSAIDMGAIIRQIKGVIDKAALAVQAVFLLTLFAGLVVLFAAVQSTLSERRYESALLRTFGASAATVRAGVGAEYLALGLAAGLLAALGATLLGWVAARELFNLSYAPSLALWLTGVFGGAAVVGLSGLIAARSAIRSSPMQVLRS